MNCVRSFSASNGKEWGEKINRTQIWRWKWRGLYTMGMDLMPRRTHLKMAHMTNFMFCTFYHNFFSKIGKNPLSSGLGHICLFCTTDGVYLDRILWEASYLRTSKPQNRKLQCPATPLLGIYSKATNQDMYRYLGKGQSLMTCLSKTNKQK